MTRNSKNFEKSFFSPDKGAAADPWKINDSRRMAILFLLSPHTLFWHFSAPLASKKIYGRGGGKGLAAKARGIHPYFFGTKHVFKRLKKHFRPSDDQSRELKTTTNCRIPYPVEWQACDGWDKNNSFLPLPSRPAQNEHLAPSSQIKMEQKMEKCTPRQKPLFLGGGCKMTCCVHQNASKISLKIKRGREKRLPLKKSKLSVVSPLN